MGGSAFAHLPIRRLIFERVYKNPADEEGQKYPYHHLYQLGAPNVDKWSKQTIHVEWEEVACPRLSSETKPHLIWHELKKSRVQCFNQAEDTSPLGLKIELQIPSHFPVTATNPNLLVDSQSFEGTDDFSYGWFRNY